MIDGSSQDYTDRLYGTCPLPLPVVEMIRTPTFDRLRRISQSGASKYAHSFKTVTRHEHSIGVYLLLRRLGASLEEQIAGLLHDISHTAFSHVIDIVYYTAEQDFHERIKTDFLNRPDLRARVEGMGLQVSALEADEHYTLLEQPLPTLCADRVDYSLRDAVAVGELNPADAERILQDLTSHQGRMVMQSAELARSFTRLFTTMNDTYWASQKENYLYEMLARAIERGLHLGAITQDDLLTDDDQVEEMLRAAVDPTIEGIFDRLVAPPLAEVAAFRPSRPIKQRYIDPPVLIDGRIVPLSKISPPPAPR